MNLEGLLETYGAVVLLAFIIKIIYHIILLAKVFDTANNTNNSCRMQNEIYETMVKNQEQLIAYMKEQNKKLERIAKALEEEPEPYIIEKEDE